MRGRQICQILQFEFMLEKRTPDVWKLSTTLYYLSVSHKLFSKAEMCLFGTAGIEGLTDKTIKKKTTLPSEPYFSILFPQRVGSSGAIGISGESVENPAAFVVRVIGGESEWPSSRVSVLRVLGHPAQSQPIGSLKELIKNSIKFIKNI